MREKIDVYVGIGEEIGNGFRAKLVSIPKDIDEVELKGRLRDMGYISSQMRPYQTTKVFLVNDRENTKVEICTNDARSLEEVGVVEKSLILITPGVPEERMVVERHYHGWENMKCLYGCPMSSKVEKDISEAEGYSLEDSKVEEFFIGE